MYTWFCSNDVFFIFCFNLTSTSTVRDNPNDPVTEQAAGDWAGEGATEGGASTEPGTVWSDYSSYRFLCAVSAHEGHQQGEYQTEYQRIWKYMNQNDTL